MERNFASDNHSTVYSARGFISVSSQEVHSKPPQLVLKSFLVLEEEEEKERKKKGKKKKKLVNEMNSSPSQDKMPRTAY